jgi:hypothetical protein
MPAGLKKIRPQEQGPRLSLSNLIKKSKIFKMISVAPSRWPVLLVALLAINWPVGIRFKRNLRPFAAISTNCIVHLSRASVEAATPFSIHGIHVPLWANKICINGINYFGWEIISGSHTTTIK